jgi:hypothetical protein
MMTKYLGAALAAAMLFASGAADAGFTRFGLIRSVDHASRTITVGPGTVLTLPERYRMSDFAPGHMVTFTFEARDDANHVSRIRDTY